jgi:hypothetical protein
MEDEGKLNPDTEAALKDAMGTLYVGETASSLLTCIPHQPFLLISSGSRHRKSKPR